MNLISRDNSFSLAAFMLFLAIIGFFHGPAAPLVLVLSVAWLAAIYYSVRLLRKDGLLSCALVLPALLFFSFAPTSLQRAGVGLSFIAALLILVSKRTELAAMISGDAAFWGGIFSRERQLFWMVMLFLVIPLGLPGRGGFFCSDAIHPFYELTCGESFARGLFSGPDLAFAGGTVRYHFLATNLPSLVSNVSGLPVWISTYVIVPALLRLGIMFSVEWFLAEFQIDVPRTLLFLMPVFFREGLLALRPGLHPLFALTSSFSVAFIVMALALVALRRERWGIFYGFAAMLMIVKASFFMVVAGGVSLLLLRRRELKKLAVCVVVCAAIFGTGMRLWLSGAHPQDQWVLLPTPLALPIAFAGGKMSAAVLGTMAAGMILSGGFFLLALYIFWKEDNHSDLGLLAAVALAGNLGYLLIAEVAEGNTSQFVVAGALPSIAVLWAIMQRAAWRPAARRGIAIAIGCLLVLTGVNTLRPMAANFFRAVFSGNQAVQKLYASLRPNSNFFVPSFSTGVLEAYSWMRAHLPADGVVLIGKHYEGGTAYAPVPRDGGFVRSAVSARPMWAENMLYRGIFMEKEFPSRLAESIFFYSHYVQETTASTALMAPFLSPAFGEKPGVPFSAGGSFWSRWLFVLGRGKKWSALNWAGQMEYETRRKMDELKAQATGGEQLQQFLHRENIRYVVLENGDRPGNLLAELTHPLFQSDGVTVLMANSANFQSGENLLESQPTDSDPRPSRF